MRFDLLSFVMGFITASVIAYVLFRLRERITALRQTTTEQVTTTREVVARSPEARYYNALIDDLNAYHLVGDKIELAKVFVEPRFLRPDDLFDPTDDEGGSVFSVVPQVYDMPAIYAPYNLPTLSINDLQLGERRIALLGMPGTGKSTALAIIGLVAAGEIELPTIDLMTDATFEDELKDKPPAEQEKLREQRRTMQERAIGQLKLARQKETEKAEEAAEKGEAPQRAAADFSELLPILIHLRDIDLRPGSYGAGETLDKPIDPAEPIVKILQKRYTGVVSSTLPRLVYNSLADGECLVLIDGYDDLSAEERTEKLAWLAQFFDVYGENFIIMTAPVFGYDPLVNLGFMPVFLRAWTEPDFTRLVEHWRDNWSEIAREGRRAAAPPDDKVVRRVMTNNRGRIPLDVTLKVWAAFTGDEQEAGRRGWYDFYVRQVVPSAEGRNLAGIIAAEILNNGNAPITWDRMLELAVAAYPPPVTDSKEGAKDAPKSSVDVDGLLKQLADRSGLLHTTPDDRFAFHHALIGGFAASNTISEGQTERLLAAAALSTWDVALPFIAAHISVDEAIAVRIGTAPDLLYTGLFSIVSWLPDSPPTAKWRTDVFKRLTAAFIAPSQYPSIRERASAALVASRDPNVRFILQQAVKSPEPLVRRLGCIAYGAVGETDAIRDLAQMLGDSDQSVQLAAGLALGAIGSDAALEAMVSGLLGGDSNLRRAVAEALAAIPGEGQAVLRDAITSKDVMVRHAAVYGLARVKAAWAIALLYRALIEDEQWYVRNAAEQAFINADNPAHAGITRYPEADSLTWLVAWAAKKGEGVPAGPNARQMLIRVLQEGDSDSKVAAAKTLAQLGHVPALKPLYGALRDRDEKVRAAAYEALIDIQKRIGEALPAVG